MATKERIRSRVFVGVLYPEDETHSAAMRLLDENKYQYVGILHNQDTYDKDDAKDMDGHRAGDPKKDHWHIVIKFTHAKSIHSLADELGIKPNYLQCCGNTTEAYRYLVHFGWEYKHQYDANECFGPLAPAVEKVCIEQDENVRFHQLMRLLDECPCISPQKFYEKAADIGMLGDVRRFGSVMIRFIDDHNAACAIPVSRTPCAGAYSDAGDQNNFRSFVEGYEAGRKNK